MINSCTMNLQTPRPLLQFLRCQELPIRRRKGVLVDATHPIHFVTLVGKQKLCWLAFWQGKLGALLASLGWRKALGVVCKSRISSFVVSFSALPCIHRRYGVTHWSFETGKRMHSEHQKYQRWTCPLGPVPVQSRGQVLLGPRMRPSLATPLFSHIFLLLLPPAERKSLRRFRLAPLEPCSQFVDCGAAPAPLHPHPSHRHILVMFGRRASVLSPY